MDDIQFPRGAEHELTRQRLAAGSLIEEMRADPPSGVRFRTDAEMEESLQAILRDHDPSQDLHVFGYGSLMWNPAMDAAHASLVHVQGWHRSFCLRSFLGRGSPQAPGAMLGLDNGGACRGLLFRIEAAKVPAELKLLWRREMFPGAYDARWIQVRGAPGAHRALTFVVNRRHERYIGRHPVAEVARLIRTGHGSLGTSLAYFDATIDALSRFGIRDAGMERLRVELARTGALNSGAGFHAGRTAQWSSR
ncbi:gamma-glutamylcyclotransferase [Variovorax sp. J22R24]|uniref:gamma-glutamylcyclotransferase n=1 Tax=Variovorax TaxID=34072 RepID=UPI002578A635|nr:MULTISPECIES: gamma-glutamylcyclotransferase [unclassified Variovorax]MDM0049963.1 gamma-glutamylcyclotransferase [Variovorax sp. J22R115]MDM0110179.1 gamma-glutamylcyclotransferase [Variovorax sp. J22R24]